MYYKDLKYIIYVDLIIQSFTSSTVSLIIIKLKFKKQKKSIIHSKCKTKIVNSIEKKKN